MREEIIKKADEILEERLDEYDDVGVCSAPFSYRGVDIDAREEEGLCQWDAWVEFSNGDTIRIGDREGGEIGRDSIQRLIDKLLDDPYGFITSRRFSLFLMHHIPNPEEFEGATPIIRGV